MKLRVEEDKIFRIPDFLICEEKGNAIRYATDPLLIVEVLSESIAHVDRVVKRREYAQIPSLQYSLIVSQAECSIEVYTRDGERWYVSFFDKMEEVINLPYFKIGLPVSTIYKKGNFPASYIILAFRGLYSSQRPAV